jgi:hypothetical protein
LRQSVTIFLIAYALAGCASGTNAVVQRGPNTFSISKEATTSGSGVTQLEVDTSREANEYCAKSGREAIAIGAREARGEYMMSVYTTELDFRCVATQTVRESTKAAIMECRDRRLKHEFKTYKQSAECSNPKILAAYESAGYPYMDLVRVLLDARLVAAENLDKGAVTETQAREQSAEFERRLMSEDQRRQAAAAASQASTDGGSFVLGLSAFQMTKRAPTKRVASQNVAFACDAVGFSGGLSVTSCY